MNDSDGNRSSYSECVFSIPISPLLTQAWVVIIMLSVFSVIGVIGNGLVIYVYVRKKDKLTASVFILALAVIKRRSKRRKEKACNKITLKSETSNCNKQTTSLLNGSNSHECKKLEVHINHNGISSKAVETEIEESTPLQKRRHTSKDRKDHDRLANIKTAVMLFTVAVVFIIAFLPAWLMALDLITHIQVIFYMYFVYNVVNPIIYAFMNPTFRQDIRKIVFRR
ncbi:hypothetical protein FSP39_003839 [Pinctada imbricata]|uniref:G-protein coupled receptors family 1 profile domain-containing protein n=1 Tax=Pinctada imbricata TaxID=66713 RepID=A0AA88YIC5_PINIB|nr:hypothetical protein FSP39_003839 [Pinctada imbricata]